MVFAGVDKCPTHCLLMTLTLASTADKCNSFVL